MYSDFEIYRPPRISSRLEPTYKPPPEDEWRPSLHYQHTLRDIKSQFTPAEFYRHKLKTSGAYIRMIQRLELRWNRRLEEFTASAIKVQSLYRGVCGRRYFKRVKEANYDSMLRRLYTPPAREAFKNGEYEQSMSFVLQAPQPWGEELHSLFIRSLFRLKRYEDCIEACGKLLVAIPKSSHSYYFHACSLTHLKQLKQAFEVIRDGIMRLTSAPNDVFWLCAGLATQQHPPEFEVAIDSFGELIRRNGRDFDAFLGRASCYVCLQEWSEAQADIQQVLAFQPVNRPALLLRARMHACNRRWAEAERDYRSILFFEPDHPQASEGMRQVQPCVEGAGLEVES